MTRYLYVGTYTQDKPDQKHRTEGIYCFNVDPLSGKLSLNSTAESGNNPSFLAFHPSGQYLYAVNELRDGEVTSFAIDVMTGALRKLNSVSTQGAAPCYVSLDPAGRWLLVANYSGGSLAVYPLEGGKILSIADFVQHEGSGPNKMRQERAHAHSIRFDPEGQFILAADLGLDKVFVYQLDSRSGKLVLHSQLETSPGAGPRHFAFHPNGRFVYVANELNSTVSACTWDGSAGVLNTLQSLPTLPSEFEGENIVADIHVHPEGMYVYVSNRGHHSLAVYTVDPISGKLNPAGFELAKGEWPRNFCLDPEGRFVYVANQLSNNLIQFQLEQRTGKLVATGDEYEIPSPVCARILDV